MQERQNVQPAPNVMRNAQLIRVSDERVRAPEERGFFKHASAQDTAYASAERTIDTLAAALP